MVAAAALAGPAGANVTASSDMTAFGGKLFPASISDGTTELLPCLDGTGACAGATADTIDPNGADPEAFYYSADSDEIPVGTGSVSLIIAHEMAYGGLDGKTPIVFSRIRYVFKPGAPVGDYHINTPYETDVVVNYDGVRRNQGVDIGCDPATAGELCNFAAANTTPVGPWLTSVSAPAGYLGDGATATDVTGSPLGVDRNAFSVIPPGSVTPLTTTKFIVTGKIGSATPHATLRATSALAFGTQRTGTASAAKSVTVRNDGTSGAGSDLMPEAASVGGANAGDFAIANDGCVGKTLAVGESCTISLRFTPSADGDRAATLNVPSNAEAGSVGLSGDGFTPAPSGGTTSAPPAGNTTIIQVIQQPGTQVKGVIASSPLAVSNLSLSRRISISRLRSQGLRASMRVQEGTNVVRIAIYKARNGQKTGRAIYTTTRSPHAAGRFVVTLRSGKLSHLKAGSYVMEVRAGASASTLGSARRITFAVTK